MTVNLLIPAILMSNAIAVAAVDDEHPARDPSPLPQVLSLLLMSDHGSDHGHGV